MEDLKALNVATEQGDAVSQYSLCTKYAHGNDVEKDEAKAARLCEQAANQGHAQAQHNLGVYYSGGRGVEKD
jgi:TPR repeat protein